MVSPPGQNSAGEPLGGGRHDGQGTDLLERIDQELDAFLVRTLLRSDEPFDGVVRWAARRRRTRSQWGCQRAARSSRASTAVSSASGDAAEISRAISPGLWQSRGSVAGRSCRRVYRVCQLVAQRGSGLTG